MNLEGLFKTRLANHQKRLAKYLRYVFNDHFVLVLMIALGGIGLSYAQFIQTLSFTHDQTTLVLIGIIAILSCLTLFGKLALLIQPADKHFLSTLENDWKPYIHKSLVYSLCLPSFIAICTVGILYPLFLKMNVVVSFVLCIVMILLKYVDLLRQVWLLKQNRPLKQWQSVVAMMLSSGIVFSLYFFVNIWASVVCVGLFIGIMQYSLQKDTALYYWEYIVDTEIKRMNQIYRLLQLFIDVPIFEETVKRRPYLDKCFTKTTRLYYYLYERAFLRGKAELSMSMQLMGMTILLRYLFSNVYLYSGILVCMLFLTGYQLLPMYQHFSGHILLEIAPYTKDEKKRDFQAFLKKILMVQLLVASVLSMLIAFDIRLMIGILIGIVFIYIIFPLYVQRKLDKI
ncbi:hypothetical protein GMA11_06945 [Granulicatella sp. zg-ZJ]|uniref:ABC transporter permease n=1 Tax=Granulicatella sp. zg-ZJ TaxID=2678504 RepID=UPI0013D8906E|nr:ABC transporter permease [Granulicatella sp. zg-ZJ]NEW63131.1 hypothetical protein [Granulicatella sp. zg-ZJ]